MYISVEIKLIVSTVADDFYTIFKVNNEARASEKKKIDSLD